jgi:hypothetical protein
MLKYVDRIQAFLQDETCPVTRTLEIAQPLQYSSSLM